MNAAAQQQGGAGVSEVVEAYLQQAGSPKKRFERSFDEVLRVDRRAHLRGEDQAVILVHAGVLHSLLQLPLTVSFEGAHRLGREPDAPAPSFRLGLAGTVAATFADEGTPYSQHTTLQVHVLPAES